MSMEKRARNRSGPLSSFVATLNPAMPTFVNPNLLRPTFSEACGLQNNVGAGSCQILTAHLMGEANMYMRVSIKVRSPQTLPQPTAHCNLGRASAAFGAPLPGPSAGAPIDEAGALVLRRTAPCLLQARSVVMLQTADIIEF